MKHRVCVLLLAATLVTSCARGGAKPQPAGPPALLPAGWQELQVQTVCLEVQQSFQETPETFSLPVEPLVRQILQGLRLRVVPAGKPCDVDLLVRLTGQPLGAVYESEAGTDQNRCYTGAKIGGEVRLTRADRAPLSLALDESMGCPSSTTRCPIKPEDAPFDALWPQAVLGALQGLWGPRVLEVALTEGEERTRLVALQLEYETGMASLPLLIQALGDESADVRGSAARLLRELGEGASEAVPALIDLLADSDPWTRTDAANALHAITGCDFGEDQARWRAWLAEGRPTPTPWTSWEGVVLMPGARWADESGGPSSLHEFTVNVSCEEAIAFYRALEVPAPAGRSPEEGVWVARGADAVHLSFADATVSGAQPRCRVRFWLFY